jgi:DNA-binding PadR family transcriptional regulator
MKNDSQLGFALLGLIRQQPMSGYDLRKIFTSTAMGSFSDSPGAIYPALARLEKTGLTGGAVEKSSSLRKRRIFKITPRGASALKAWMEKPVTRDDVVRNTADLMLRFAFMDGMLGAESVIRFLGEFAARIESYLHELRTYLEAHASKMPLSGRLALECGIQEYVLRLHWARTSASLYEKKNEKGKKGRV